MQALLEKAGFESSGVIHNLDVGDPELVYVKQLDRDAVSHEASSVKSPRKE